MIILGLDPGLAILGYGVVEYKAGGTFRVLDYGCVTTKANTSLPQRLLYIGQGVEQLCLRFSPDAVAAEELFFSRNVTTAIMVAQARGAALMCAARHTGNLFEYTPLQVKQAVVGYGRADKHQVQEMVRLILHLSEIPKPDDAADALAIAICHAHSSDMPQSSMI
jgi:crossover junction endodeoxyribonuclease RuvC